MLDNDVWQAASHRAMRAHLTAPFQAGATDSLLEVAPDASITVDWQTREPLLLIAPRADLATHRLRVRALGIELEFAPFTEAGAFLPLGVPATTGFLRAQLEAELDGNAVPAPEVRLLLEARLLEGLIGRVLYVMAAEKQRIRRQAREIAAMRQVPLGRDDALDRLGAELSVPRFTERLDYTATRGVFTVARREPDDEYRRRLRLYKPFALPTRRRLLDVLNGPGGEAQPNNGVFAELGLTHRFTLVEEDSPFATAIHLVAAGDPAQRTMFLNAARQYYLVWPRNDPVANSVHAARHQPAATRELIRVQRASLRARFRWPANAAVAPLLAQALDRLGKVRAALGGSSLWTVQRAQDMAGGSRYELGLGVDLEPLPSAALDQLRAAQANPKRPPSTDPEIEAIVTSLRPLPAADDPDGRWLLEPCGLRTVHRLSATSLYVSHTSMAGLVVTGLQAVEPSLPLSLAAYYEAPGSPHSNALLASALAVADKEWRLAARPPWTVLSDAAARERWKLVTNRPSTDPALAIFQAAGLPAVTVAASVVERLERIAPELLETIVVPASVASSATLLRELGRTLGRNGIASALPLIAGSDTLLVVSVVGLPLAGINLADRRTSGFHWYALPLVGSGGAVRAVGSRTDFTPNAAGLTAIVVIGYTRSQLTDPFEVRVELPDDAHLNLAQYEFLMNVLDHAHPMGVEINTYAVRDAHVDLDGDGAVDPLLPVATRTFRPFRRPRHRGEAGVPVAP